ncbi:hypothetical protein HMPREF2757_00665 [Brevibacterium sp. HMSC063G07]|nr:hypothetical protein HMPREF2757_00665 [Brevibacterium sp. HMSC063G07]OFS27301.1 hypothetical protein HMPREF3162_02540 [Brevibacterium sp. HMSC07C04]
MNTHGLRAEEDFFLRPALSLAPDLLGRVLIHSDADGTVALRITEVEAYVGSADPGSHAFNGKTERNQTMFRSGGHLYCYFIYGMHFSINLVADRAGCGTGVLIRSGEILEGEDLAQQRRMARRSTPVPHRLLASGPGNLAQALGADRDDDGADLISPGEWHLRLGSEQPDRHLVRNGPRVGVGGQGGDPAVFPWRYWIDGEPSVSKFRAGRHVRPAGDWAIGPPPQ